VEKHHVQISWSLDLPRLNIYHTRGVQPSHNTTQAV